MDFNLNFHPLDNLIKDKSSFWLEALVPFVDYKYKKLLIIYIKYKELNAILQCLEDISYVESCGFNCKAHSMDDVISGLTGFMPKDFSDNIKQMKGMLDMMKVMNQMDSGLPNMSSFMNQMDNGVPNMSAFMNQTDNGVPNMSASSNQQESDYHNQSDNYNQNNNNDDLFESIKSILDQEQ